jgi:pimeloyl-ACP methyl ester carboxylesterase
MHKANELAGVILDLKSDDAERPIYLVGKSGGAGLALAAAAQLPSDTLERIILLSPAVTPGHDLRPALRATRREIVSFHSPLDRIVLGWGTTQFGTIDRSYGPSAGLSGFRIPADVDAADRALFGRLVQIPWTPRMLLGGNNGSHLGTSMPGFIGKEVAPWLKH